MEPGLRASQAPRLEGEAAGRGHSLAAGAALLGVSALRY